MPNPIVHFEIGAKDGKRAMDFYGKLFDWKVEFIPQMNYGMVSRQNDEGIGGGIYETKDGMQPSVTVYIQVDDLQTYLDKAAKLGGKLLVPPTEISPEIGDFAMFADPDGNTIGLYKTK